MSDILLSKTTDTNKAFRHINKAIAPVYEPSFQSASVSIDRVASAKRVKVQSITRRLHSNRQGKRTVRNNTVRMTCITARILGRWIHFYYFKRAHDGFVKTTLSHQPSITSTTPKHLRAFQAHTNHIVPRSAPCLTSSHFPRSFATWSTTYSTSTNRSWTLSV